MGANRFAHYIFSNMGILFAERILRTAVTFIFMVLLAKYFSTDLFGQLSFAIALCSILSVIAGVGMDSIIIQELIVSSVPKKTILGSALRVRLICGILLVLFSNAGLFLFEENILLSAIVFLISAGIVFQSYEIIEYYFQSISKFQPIVSARMAALLLSIFVKIFFLLNDYGVLYIAFSFLLDTILLVGFWIYIFRGQEPPLLDWVYERTVAVSLIKKGFPLFISSVCVVLIMQLDKIFIGLLRASYDVGIYSVATQFSGVWNIVPVVVGAALVPGITRLFDLNREQYNIDVQKICSYLSLAAVIICAATVLLGKEIIAYGFGDRYAASSDLLMVHIWSIIFIFHVSIRTRLLIIEGSLGVIAILSLLTAIISIASNLVLVNYFGAVGAAYGCLLSWGASALLLPTLFGSTRHYPYLFLKSFIFHSKI
jgi:O-antigen/teichoic acid export membrane protein